MNKKQKQTKRQRDIKSKLMAAIAMLLVSSTMMVSTTYAWFTLSTAPEVTGISTSVGANGNLEMALLPTSGKTEDITSAAGDSNLPINQKNITWGNLVDLNATETFTYGLEKIVLYPSALNIQDSYFGTDGYFSSFPLNGTWLKTPTYGADGRVAELLANTVQGTYVIPEGQSTGSFNVNQLAGVRAIGTSSGMTERQLAYRNALAEADSLAIVARNKAATALQNHGNGLASIAIKKAADNAGTATYGQTDLAPLKRAVNELLASDGALAQLEKAYVNYIVAYSASSLIDSLTITLDGTALDATAKEELYKVFEGAAASGLAGLETLLGNYGLSLSSITGLNDAVTKYKTTKGNVQQAKTTLDALTGDSHSWNEISAAVNLLANPSSILINGYKSDEVMANAGSIISSGIVMSVQTGGGVFADVADQAGNYTATLTGLSISYGGFTVNNVKATMKTESSVVSAGSSYLGAISTGVTNKAPEKPSGTGTALPITDMYGYIIDLAFRTNAATSNLMLQMTPADRIYDGNTNDTTAGAGSTMTFTSIAEGLSDDQAKGLMNAIRIVFFTAGAEGNNEVLLEARLDGDGAEKVSPTEWKADLLPFKTKKNADGTKTQELVMGEDGGEKVTLMPLNQNQAHTLSVMVYLDGENVTNADVATNGTSSMSGMLNLQFSSSADLVPMEYADLHVQGSGSGSGSDVTMNKATAGIEYPEGAISFVDAPAASTDFTFTLNSGWTLGEVKQGETTINAANNGDGTYTITMPADITTAVTINATSNSVKVTKNNILISGADTAVKNAAYTFTLRDKAYTVDKINVGGTTLASGQWSKDNLTYTIIGTAVTGDIEIVTSSIYVDVELPSGATGEKTATKGVDYIFTYTVSADSTMTVTVGGTTVQPGHDTETDTWTIPGDSVTGKIVVTVAANETGTT